MKSLLFIRTRMLLVLAVLSFIAASCGGKEAADDVVVADTGPKAEDVIDEYNKRLPEFRTLDQQAAWLKATHTTDESKALAAFMRHRLNDFYFESLQAAREFDQVAVGEDTARALDIIRRGPLVPLSRDAAKRRELVDILDRMQQRYIDQQYCLGGVDKTAEEESAETCLSYATLIDVLINSRDADALKSVWASWREFGSDQRKDFQRYVVLVNEAARELGYQNAGELWQSDFGMPAVELQREVQHLWDGAQGIYKDLHCYVRDKLAETYDEETLAFDELLPAHVLGSMWAENWQGIYALVRPFELENDPAFRLDKALAEEYKTAGLVRESEAFFTSMGLSALPATLHKRSMTVWPDGIAANCGAKAWSIDGHEDVRLSVCGDVDTMQLSVINRVLSETYYSLADNALKPVYQKPASPDFPLAIGGLVDLSMTPSYFQQLGVLGKNENENERDALVNRQLHLALKVFPSLARAYMMDAWRWQVFSGQTMPERYSIDWWRLHIQHRGLRPPLRRNESDFDPGAEQAIITSEPYLDEFFATFLQFQMLDALCGVAGEHGPLHECSIYGNKATGEALTNLMKVGASQNWRDTLQQLTGKRRVSGEAMLEYFRPLEDWLYETNIDRSCGWY